MPLDLILSSGTAIRNRAGVPFDLRGGRCMFLIIMALLSLFASLSSQF